MRKIFALRLTRPLLQGRDTRSEREFWNGFSRLKRTSIPRELCFTLAPCPQVPESNGASTRTGKRKAWAHFIVQENLVTEQELARALVGAGIVSAVQVRAAVEKRRNGIGIAQALVESGAAQAPDILGIVPDAFSIGGNPPAQNGAASTRSGAESEAATATTLVAVEETPYELGLGTGDAIKLDDSGVRFADADENREDDPVMGTIVTYCNELLKIAVQMGASDMHLEPREAGLLPRYRVDGRLRAGGIIPRELQPPIISRFKVLANLDITENRMPQDGRFRATIGGRVFDFRVSTLPSVYGEKVVMRLLDRSSLVTDLRRLGFSDHDRKVFEEMLGLSYGMILVTGPTGSGKTTTLYAALSITRDETKNVITVEDPVEYELPGVTQTMVQTEIDLTFATQLRAILRQDPDVILVGEIRDYETAEVAIRAALTGHLVLSTLHTNTAVGAVTRLQDMGVPPYLIASSLSGCLAQRLVRLICFKCREQVSFDSPEYREAAVKLKLPADIPIYHGIGCAACGETGYRGRIAVTELLTFDADMRRAVMEKVDADTLRRIATASDMKTLWDDGLEKLRSGLTTAEEIARVLLAAQDEI